MLKKQQILQKINGIKGIMPQASQIVDIGLISSGPRVEIGCLAGLSTCCLALSAPNDELVISIDPFRLEYLSPMAKGVLKDIAGNDILKQESFHSIWERQVFSVCKNKNINAVIGDRLEKLSDVKKILGDKEIGLLFLDGLHSYEAVRDEIKAYLPLVKSGGFILFHDYSPTMFGVKQAVDEAVKDKRIIAIKSQYLFVAKKP